MGSINDLSKDNMCHCRENWAAFHQLLACFENFENFPIILGKQST